MVCFSYRTVMMLVDVSVWITGYILVPLSQLTINGLQVNTAACNNMSEVSKHKREAHAPLNSQYCSIKIIVIEDPVYRKEKSTTNSSINMSPPPLMVTLANTNAWIFDHSGYPCLKCGYLGYHLPLD